MCPRSPYQLVCSGWYLSRSHFLLQSPPLLGVGIRLTGAFFSCVNLLLLNRRAGMSPGLCGDDRGETRINVRKHLLDGNIRFPVLLYPCGRSRGTARFIPRLCLSGRRCQYSGIRESLHFCTRRRRQTWSSGASGDRRTLIKSVWRFKKTFSDKKHPKKAGVKEKAGFQFSKISPKKGQIGTISSGCYKPLTVCFCTILEFVL